MERDLLTLFGLGFEEIEMIIDLVTVELRAAILRESTINGIKTSCLRRVIERLGETTPEKYGIAGIMVEQAYRAAVAESMSKKPQSISAIFSKKSKK